MEADEIICQRIAKKMYNIMQEEIKKISKLRDMPTGKGVELSIGTTAILSAAIIDLAIKSSDGHYKEKDFYNDVSVIFKQI
ncbi:MAG: hypothetical protein K0R24_1915 [Gammaproteobacteria bacterium]|jgi:hypothetical protein|nr:hypothetical protein [Gammaproteobacteria bacterium]